MLIVFTRSIGVLLADHFDGSGLTGVAIGVAGDVFLAAGLMLLVARGVRRWWSSKGSKAPAPVRPEDDLDRQVFAIMMVFIALGGRAGFYLATGG